MCPVNEWKLPHVKINFMGAHLVSLCFVVKPQQHLKSSVRFILISRWPICKLQMRTMCVLDWSISDRRLNWKPLPFPLCFNHSINVTIVFFIPSIHLTRVTVNDTFGVMKYYNTGAMAEYDCLTVLT